MQQVYLEICSLMIVHLKLQYDSEEYVDVVRMGVHNYVEDAFLLDLPKVCVWNMRSSKLPIASIILVKQFLFIIGTAKIRKRTRDI